MNRPVIPDIPELPPTLPKIIINEDIGKKRIAGDKRGVKRIAGKGKRVMQSELCAYLSVADTSVKKWVKLGLPRKKEGNRFYYDIGEVMRWRIQWETESLQDELVQASQGNGDKMSPFQAKLRKEVAQALTAELDLAIKREQVANIDDLMEAFSTALIEVRAKLVSMSSRLGGILSHQDEEAIAKLLDDEVADMLEVLSDYD